MRQKISKQYRRMAKESNPETFKRINRVLKRIDKGLGKEGLIKFLGKQRVTMVTSMFNSRFESK